MAGMPALPLPPRGSMEWQQLSACQWADPTLFISIDKRPGRNDRDRIAEAVRYCAQCSVARECLDWALENEESGVYGGRYLAKGGRLLDLLKED